MINIYEYAMIWHKEKQKISCTICRFILEYVQMLCMEMSFHRDLLNVK